MRSKRRDRARGPVAIGVLAVVSSLSALALLAMAPRLAWAHTVGLSRGEYALSGDHVDTKLTLARGELATAVPGLDANHDGTIDEAELSAGKEALRRSIVERLVVASGNRLCEGTLGRAALTEQDGVEIDATFACAGPPSEISVDAAFLDAFPSGHRHVAHLSAGSTERDEVLYRNKEHFVLDAGAAPGARPQAPSSWHAVAWGFFLQGIEHILTGYDHLCFLLGLVLVRGRLKSVFALVTAFTIAHSVTLALAVLGVYAPSARITEPAIALSVAYVGGENFFVKDLKNRWHITAPFGLVHGFGFAGALGQIALPRPQIPIALATFNLGVEAGQLGVLAVVLPAVHFARKHPFFDRWGVKVLSFGLVVVGLVWFVSRIVWPPP